MKIWLGNENSIIEYEMKRSELMNSDKYNSFLSMFPGSGVQESILSIDGDTASIKIFGMLTTNGPDFIDKILGLGGTAYHEIIKSVNEISKNDSIKNVILNIDSPGGEAIPVDAVWKSVFKLRSSKNITAVNQGQVSSAAYYIASAANNIKAASNMVLTGSIGAVITTRKKNEWGSIVEVVSSNADNKRPDVSTRKGMAVIQERADSIERVFIKRISEGRGISEEKIRNDFGEGNIFVALDPDKEMPDAISVGMIDGLIDDSIVIPIKSGPASMESEIIVESVFDTEQQEIIEEQTPAGASSGEINQENQEVSTMSFQKYLAENPDAQKEYNAEITAAEARGEKKIQDKITAVAPFLSDEKYKKAHKNGIKVLTGDMDIHVFQGGIGFIDMDTETSSSAAAQVETEEIGDTQPVVAGAVDPQIDFEARKKRLKEGGA